MSPELRTQPKYLALIAKHGFESPSVYHHAHEILEHYDPNDDVSICLHVTPAHDRWHYNLPTIDEVVVILPGIDSDNRQLSQCDIILQNHTGGLQIINDLHPC